MLHFYLINDWLFIKQPSAVILQNPVWETYNV